MPLYEYACEECGTRFEKLVSLSQAQRGTRCPKCASKSVRKLMSAVASISRQGGGVSECPTCPTGTCDL